MKTAAVIGAVIVLAAGTTTTIWHAPARSYRDKPLLQWLRELEVDPKGTDGEASRALREAGTLAVPTIITGLHEGSADLRMRCACVLGYVQPSSPVIVRELQHSLSETNEFVVTFVAQALRMIAERDSNSQLTAELEEALPQLRQACAEGRDERGQVGRAVAAIEAKQGKRN